MIALPLNQSSLSNGNSCFIDPVTLLPFDDQWAFLQIINRVSISHLNNIYKAQSEQDSLETGLFQKESSNGELHIVLNNEIHISRAAFPAMIIAFLKDELNFANNEYQVKKSINKNTFGIKRYFKLLNETSESISIPRSYIGRLLRFCKE